MSRTTARIGPSDHGQRLSLDEFEDLEAEPGYSYELGRGMVVVTDVPKPKHLRVLNAIRRQFVDPGKRSVLVLRRNRGRWAERVVGPGDVIETVELPGFRFACGPVFEAAGVD